MKRGLYFDLDGVFELESGGVPLFKLGKNLGEKIGISIDRVSMSN